MLRTYLLKIDFASPEHTYRRLHGGGNGQPIAKAIGIKKYGLPLTVIDATAGLGSDAFVLASLGCEVTMIERNPQIAAKLQAALDDAPDEIIDIINRMNLVVGDAIELLPNMQADVVYLDPMFPERTKSALVKQDMRDLKDIVGNDADADALLLPALSAAKRRAVVKRPKMAPLLNNQQPHVSLPGKANRFDVYVP